MPASSGASFLGLVTTDDHATLESLLGFSPA